MNMNVINELVEQFQEITGMADIDHCFSILNSNHWDVNEALLNFFEHDSDNSNSDGEAPVNQEDIHLISCVYDIVPKRDLSSMIPKAATFRELNFTARETVVVELNNSPIVWYKKALGMFEWKIISPNVGVIEKAYLEHTTSSIGLNEPLQIYFDDFMDDVLIDFDKMTASHVLDTDIVLYHLKRKNTSDGLPSEWDWNEGTIDTYKLVELDHRSSEFAYVCNAATISVSNECYIEKIERVENSAKYKQYIKLKEHLEEIHKNRSGYVAEGKLFHGTHEFNVHSICENGFNPDLCGQRGAFIGGGCYFTNSFIHSARYSSKIFFCNALTGVYTSGISTTTTAPKMDWHKTIKFDSIVNNADNPNIFGVLTAAHLYPAYLITRKDTLYANTIKTTKIEQAGNSEFDSPNIRSKEFHHHAAPSLSKGIDVNCSDMTATSLNVDKEFNAHSIEYYCIM